MGETTIPLSRLEELLDKETRLKILEERVINGCVNREDVLRIIGSENAVKAADKIREEEKKMTEKYGGCEDAEM